MAITPGAAWLAAVSNAEYRPVFRVQIIGSSTIGQCLTASVETTSDLYTDEVLEVGAVAVSPIAIEIDPFTRETKIGECWVDFLDKWIRPLIYANRLHGKKITVTMGAPGLDGTDFINVFTGPIEEIAPDYDSGVIRVSVVDAMGVLDAAAITGYWMNKHPLEVIYKGDGTGILELAGLPAAMIDTAAFDPSTLTTLGHIVVSRVNTTQPVYSGNYHDLEQADWGSMGLPFSARVTAQEVLQMLHGHLVVTEEGKISCKLYSAATASVDDWTEDDIVPGSWEQSPLGENIINRIIYRYGRKPFGGNDYGQAHQVDETASQALYVYPGMTERIVSRELKAGWKDTVFRLGADITAAATSFDLHGSTLHGLSGNRSDAWAAISAGQPLYLLLDSTMRQGTGKASGQPPNAEIIKCTSLNRDTTHQGELGVFDPNTKTWSMQSGWCSKVALASVTRAMFGTTATTHAGYLTSNPTWVYDVTPIVILLDSLLARFAYGCPIVSLSTPLHKAWLQVGDFVTLTTARYIDYLDDGITSSDKWEIISKEVDAFASPPACNWVLAKVVNETITRAHDSYGLLGGLPDTVAEGVSRQSVSQGYVESGLGITAGAGLVGVIAAGTATNGVSRARLLVDRSHTFTASKDTYVFISLLDSGLRYEEKALGAAAASTGVDEVYLGKVVTGAAAIGSIDTSAQVTAPIRSAALQGLCVIESKIGVGAVTENKVGTGAITTTKIGDGAVSTGKVTTNAIGTRQMAANTVQHSTNFDFSMWGRG
jgi:hypothetical protein